MRSRKKTRTELMHELQRVEETILAESFSNDHEAYWDRVETKVRLQQALKLGEYAREPEA